ncbi:unnamed protein product [Lymnaea stagnalis]|uniref:Uncharacterized protein n=1 Tax=Lymnaea stagnalis TaxID=6523 RepID=A0AAV2HBZ5_LYMST
MVMFEPKDELIPADQLIQAIKRDDSKTVNRLLKKQICIPDLRINDDGQTPLILAVTHKKIKCVEVLLKRKAKVDAVDRTGMTAAMYAADRGHLDILQLMKGKADFNKADSEGATALMLSCQWGYDECVQFFINHQCDVNQRDRNGKTALMYAAAEGKIHSVKCLLNSKSDVNAISSEKYTALMYALKNKEIETAKLLINRGAKVDRMGSDGKTSLTYAFQNCLSDFTIVECVLKNGADLTLSKTDQSYLHEMVARGEAKIVRLMVINGCPPFDRRCSESCFNFNHHEMPISPLCVALLSGHDDIAQYFIVNKFFTSYDMFTLSNESELKIKLEDEVCDAPSVLDCLPWFSPHSLSLLSFVFICGVLTLRPCSTRVNKEKEVMTFKLPQQITDQLLFQQKSVHLCTLSWHDISLAADQDLEDCHCIDCEDERTRGISHRQMGGQKIKLPG